MAVYINPALGGSLGSRTRQVLDGVEYRISLLWLDEATRADFQLAELPPLVLGLPGAWTLTLSSGDGTVLAAGQFLRHGVNMVRPWQGDPRFPGAGFGQLLAWDLSGLALDPGRNDLDPGASRRLVYRTAAEST